MVSLISRLRHIAVLYRVFFALICFSLSVGGDAFDDNDFWDYSMCTNLSVAADTPLVVKAFNNDTQNAQFSWDAVRVYLAKAANYSDATEGPVCILISCMPINTTTFTITIPSNVGPSAGSPHGEQWPGMDSYDLSYLLYDSSSINMREEYDTDKSSLGYTNGWNSFNLTGANSPDYAFEVSPVSPSSFNYTGAWPWGLEKVPCEAYGCARACVDRFYPDYSSYNSSFDAQIRPCIKECPGVTKTVNYCQNVGGSTMPAAPTYTPDGCVKYGKGRYGTPTSSVATASPTITGAASPTASSVRGSSVRVHGSLSVVVFLALLSL